MSTKIETTRGYCGVFSAGRGADGPLIGLQVEEPVSGGAGPQACALNRSQARDLAVELLERAFQPDLDSPLADMLEQIRGRLFR